MNGLMEFVRHIRAQHHPRVISTWLNEFGYVPHGDSDQFEALSRACQERGPRLERELDAHGKRLADRAQFDARRMTGRAGVIPRDAAGLERPSNYGKGPTRY